MPSSCWHPDRLARKPTARTWTKTMALARPRLVVSRKKIGDRRLFLTVWVAPLAGWSCRRTEPAAESTGRIHYRCRSSCGCIAASACDTGRMIDAVPGDPVVVPCVDGEVSGTRSEPAWERGWKEGALCDLKQAEM